MRVAKWQALGNHFLIVEEPPWPITPARARLLCDAALGLGADGVLELSLGETSRPSSCTTATARSPRCRATARASPSPMRPSASGAASCACARGPAPARRRVRRRRPHRRAPRPGRRWPARRRTRARRDPGVGYRFVSVGNPHCVLTVADPGAFPLAEEGPRLEQHPRFPERTNVEAIAVARSATACACGSGSAASARRRPAAPAPAPPPSPRSSTAPARRPSRSRCPAAASRSGVDGELALTLTGHGPARLRRRARRRAARAARARRPDARLEPARRRSRVPLDAAHAHGRRGPGARRRRDLARHRRPGHATAARAARGDRRARRCATSCTSTRRTTASPRCARPWPRTTARRFGVELDPRARDPAAARRQGGARAPLPRAARSRATSRSWPIPATRSTTAARRSPAARRSACRCAPSTASCPTSMPIAEDVSRRANLLICGYPNNPTGAVADLAFFERLAAWGHAARRADLPRQRLRRADLRRHRGAELPGRAGRARGRHRDLLALEVALDARLAHRLRRRQRRADRAPAHAQDEHRLGHVARAAARGDARGRARAVVHGGPARALRPPPRRALRRAGAARAGVRAPERRALRLGARPGRRRLGGVRRAAARARPPSWSGPARPTAGERRLRAAVADGPEERLAEAARAHRAAL